MSKIITIYEQNSKEDHESNIALLAEEDKEGIEVSIGNLIYGKINKLEALEMAQSIISFYEN